MTGKTFSERRIFALVISLLFLFVFFAAVCPPAQAEQNPQSIAATDNDSQATLGNKITYLRQKNVKIDGRKVLRIELGLDKNNVQYTVSTKPYLKKQVIVSFANTKMVSRVTGDFRPANDLASLITVGEDPKGRGSAVVTVNMTGQVLRGSYNVYTVPANVKTDEPTRVVIEIIANPDDDNGGIIAAGKTFGAVTGGHTVVIDPGHGGSDTGAIGYVGSQEKDICLAVAKKVRSALANYGINAIMTRETDRDVFAPDTDANQELQARVNVQTTNPSAEIFVSIHCNAFTNPATGGTETYYYAGSPQGYRLANFVNEELLRAGGLSNRGVKTAKFYVIKNSGVPAILTELGFITNPAEEQLLSNENYQTKIADGIARGISRYFGGR